VRPPFLKPDNQSFEDWCQAFLF